MLFLFRSSMTIAGLAVVGLIGGCCTSGTCGTATTSPEPVYSNATYTQSAPADCGCGCSAAPSMSYDSYSQPTQAEYDQPELGSSNMMSEVNSSNQSLYTLGDIAGSPESPTVVVPPSDSTTSGFTARSASKAIDNALPGNFLPSK